VLPRSGLVLSIATLYWQTSTAFDKRDAVKPVIDAELSSADERAGADPVLRAIARYVPLREALAADLRQADPDGIARVVRRYTADPTYRYADFENAINLLGYEELGAKRTPNALALFRANVTAYPQSWNAYDSLGEALLAAGLVPDSAAAYRHALQLAPDTVKPRLRAIVAKLGG
jgi:tetratricopeptide (TPR) repeat protein